MPKTQIIKRFEWCDYLLPILTGSLHEDDVLIFDHKTGIAYTGDIMSGSGDLTKEVCDHFGGDEWDTIEGVYLLYLEEV